MKNLSLFVLLAITAKISSGQSPLPLDSNEIAFASDTQAPMWVESLWLKKTNNKQATSRLFNNIAERRPGSLFILGDVVNLGSSNRQWKPMDKYINNLRTEGIQVHAVLGNHEVMGRARRGESKFQKRFPDHVSTGYVQVKDSVAIVLLNSNFNKLSKAADAEQEKWYRATLAQLDADPAIQFIVTGCHHSPYTNSTIVKPSAAVQEKFVQPFLASTKSRLFISGHCHGFEHFKLEGKDFLVIGGGGGLHQPLKEGNGRMVDEAADYKPLFHYITVKRAIDHLMVTSYRITNDHNSFEEGLALRVDHSRTIDIAATPAASSSGTGALQ